MPVRARATTSSECPRPYAAAVSIQLMPCSMAWRMASIESVSSWAPRLALGAAQRPGAESDAGDVHTGGPERACRPRHGALLPWRCPASGADRAIEPAAGGLDNCFPTRRRWCRSHRERSDAHDRERGTALRSRVDGRTAARISRTRGTGGVAQHLRMAPTIGCLDDVDRLKIVRCIEQHTPEH